MYGFADRIDPLDRWAIVAYVRALQRSRGARTLADIPPGRTRPTVPRDESHPINCGHGTPRPLVARLSGALALGLAFLEPGSL